MVEVQINLIAVLVAAAVSYILGGFWYSPLLFGKNWTAALGKSEEELKQVSKIKAYLGSLIATLIMAYVMAHFVAYANASTLLLGATTGFWAWLGFVATTGLINSLFQGKSMKLFIIDAGYFLVGMILMGAILGVWR